MGDTIIKIENLSKQYRLGTVGTGTLSHDINRWWAKARGKDDPFLKIGEINDRTQISDSEYIWALRNINIEINRGDVVGIIGRNGAGKSTLLKILSKVTRPTTGCVKLAGRIASLLEVGTGFHPEMTGRENIYLNGAILGMKRKEIHSKFDEIVAFAGVEKYVDTPVKRYSSGMYVRLAFAVAAHLEPEILVIDEVLAVGDAEFQKKCLGKMQDISKNDGRTVLFVSHNMAAIKTLCKKGIVLENGTTVFDGTQTDAISYYQNNIDTIDNFEHEGPIEKAPGNNNIRILKFQVVQQEGEYLTMLSGIDFLVDFYCGVENSNIDITFEVSTQDDLVLFHNGLLITQNNDSKKGVYSIKCSLPKHLLNAGIYSISILFGQNQRYILYKKDSFISFEVLQETLGSNSNRIPGIIFPELKFEQSFKTVS
jgi:lipopolysaccharide transport system ATP-binding protein